MKTLVNFNKEKCLLLVKNKRVLIALILVVSLVVTGTLSVYVAQKSIPGEVLYSLKQTLQTTQSKMALEVSPSPVISPTAAVSSVEPKQSPTSTTSPNVSSTPKVTPTQALTPTPTKKLTVTPTSTPTPTQKPAVTSTPMPTQKPVITSTPIPSPTSTPTPEPILKTFALTSIGITVNYPANWVTPSDEDELGLSGYADISELPFTVSDRIDNNTSKYFNTVGIGRERGEDGRLVSPPLLNSQYFNKLYNLKIGESMTEDEDFRGQVVYRITYTKILSLRVASGQNTVILKKRVDDLQNGTSLYMVDGLILKGETLYSLGLNHYNSSGQDVFIKIVASARIS